MQDADADNLCLSGGAKGADFVWGLYAGLAGHRVAHFSFVGHRTRVPASQIHRLTEAELAAAIPQVRRAAIGLGKHPPTAWFPHNLICRNWYQVAEAQRLYAVSTIEKGKVAGGTGWAVQMFLDRLADEGRSADGLLYCFDQVRDLWVSYHSGVWVADGPPPRPEGVWAGIGARDLRPNGEAAIAALMVVQTL